MKSLFSLILEATRRSSAGNLLRCVEMGVGELFINSIDRDGGAMGFDIDGIESVASQVNVPVIGCVCRDQSTF